MSELNLWLDSYDDIYSDFDSRHYIKRRISEDFLHELHVELKYAERHAGELVLLLPGERRDEAAEKIIAESLSVFYKARLLYYQNRCRIKNNNGLLFLFSGIAIMMLNSWISFQSPVSLALGILKVLLEPAGWFLLWAAFDILFYSLADLKKERNFYRDLNEMHIRFKTS